ncbi:NYN domain-containing protein [Paraburkholderia sp. GAS334]|uniref:NYN domain-containing protein n=1 Tax=Paraburkholderia sp. GAS334 TaxID=3035131 RepID=UPI003D1D133A
MTSSSDTPSMALFCDFENVALGVRDAKFEKFDIKLVLERLLLKGSIVVKKAYCDWERYKGFKSAMHEANFELIEIPHVRQSGKNSADIRLVVDALDLCYTKSHVNTFVIISGDSDFSPLVSKLRENAKQVIGVGVKQSTSDLLIANCDEFIFYDDLARESQRAAAKRSKEAQPVAERSTDKEKHRREDIESRRSEAIEIAVQTFDALVTERGDSGKVWASALKDAIKRRKPDFSESYYGFRAFGNLLEEAQARGLFEVGRDEKSGTFVFRGNSGAARSEPVNPRQARSKRGARRQAAPEPVAVADVELPVTPDVFAASDMSVSTEAVTEPAAPAEPAAARRKGRGSRKTSAKKAKSAEVAEAAHAPSAPDTPVDIPLSSGPEAQPEHSAQPDEPAPKAKKTARKTAPRARRPRKAAAAEE